MVLYTLHGVENVPFNYTCLQRKSSFQLHMQRKIHLWSSLNKSGKFVQFLKLVNFFWQNDALFLSGPDDATTAQWSKLRGHVWLFSKIGTSKYVENQYFKIPLIQMFILNRKIFWNTLPMLRYLILFLIASNFGLV